MIGSDDWPFSKARSIAADHGMHITAVYGSELNLGSTDLALDRILANFKQVLIVSNELTYGQFTPALQLNSTHLW